MDKKINIFIGGSTDINISKNYRDFALFLGDEINKRDYEIIFDGCSGLPSVVYDCLSDKMRSLMFYSEYYPMPKISGRIKQFDKQSNVMRSFINASDAMIFMKGGMGTLAEITYALDSKKNKEHDNPIVIININNEWDELINLLKTYDIDNLYFVTDNVDDCLNYIEKHLYNENSKFYNTYVKYNSPARCEPIINNKTK